LRVINQRSLNLAAQEYRGMLWTSPYHSGERAWAARGCRVLATGGWQLGTMAAAEHRSSYHKSRLWSRAYTIWKVMLLNENLLNGNLRREALLSRNCLHQIRRPTEAASRGVRTSSREIARQSTRNRGVLKCPAVLKLHVVVEIDFPYI
jgi:hypothetical protein